MVLEGKRTDLPNINHAARSGTPNPTSYQRVVTTSGPVVLVHSL